MRVAITNKFDNSVKEVQIVINGAGSQSVSNDGHKIEASDTDAASHETEDSNDEGFWTLLNIIGVAMCSAGTAALVISIIWACKGRKNSKGNKISPSETNSNNSSGDSASVQPVPQLKILTPEEEENKQFENKRISNLDMRASLQDDQLEVHRNAVADVRSGSTIGARRISDSPSGNGPANNSRIRSRLARNTVAPEESQIHKEQVEPTWDVKMEP